MSPDFVLLAQSMGFDASRIGSATEFITELEKAVAGKKPTMIVVDMEAVGPMAKPFEAPLVQQMLSNRKSYREELV